VLKDVPPNCVVVGNPGRIVVQDGRRVEEQPLTHGRDLDPDGEMLRCLIRKVEELELRLRKLEENQDGASPV
ncbi:MAG: serine O-acetyltransferase, partial [Armatimonadota bacterium]